MKYCNDIIEYFIEEQIDGDTFFNMKQDNCMKNLHNNETFIDMFEIVKVLMR